MSDKPYTVIRLWEHRVPTFVLHGPTHVAAFWGSSHEAQSHADNMNAAYSAGQASTSTDRAKLIEALQLSANALGTLPHHHTCAYIQDVRGGYDSIRPCSCGQDAALARLKELGITPTQP